MSQPIDCEIRDEVEKAVELGGQFVRSVRKLRRSLKACEKCADQDDCVFTREFMSMVNEVITEINHEWGLVS